MKNYNEFETDEFFEKQLKYIFCEYKMSHPDTYYYKASVVIKLSEKIINNEMTKKEFNDLISKIKFANAVEKIGKRHIHDEISTLCGKEIAEAFDYLL